MCLFSVGIYLLIILGHVLYTALVHSVSTGIDLGKAYDIPPHLKSEPFYAAVVLKVSQSVCVFPCAPGLGMHSFSGRVWVAPGL